MAGIYTPYINCNSYSPSFFLIVKETGSQSLNNLPKITQLISNRLKISLIIKKPEYLSPDCLTLATLELVKTESLKETADFNLQLLLKFSSNIPKML